MAEPPQTYLVEDEPEDDGAHRVSPPSPSSHDADAPQEFCPDCGAAIDPGDEVCIRCGFARGGERPAAKRAARADEVSSDEPDEQGRPISPSGKSHGFDVWLPIVLGAAALVLLMIGHLAGAMSLFPELRLQEIEAVPWGARFAELLRNLVLLAFWAGCGLAGLFGLALMFERPLGDARIAALRMGAIMATIRLAAFLSVPGPRWVEWMTESIVQAAAFVALSMLLFRLPARNAGVLALWTLLTILVLWLFTYAVQWALGG